MIGQLLLKAKQFSTSPGPRYTASYEYWRWKMRRNILRTRPVPTWPTSDLSVRYLVCHEHLLEVIWAAKSLLADDRIRDWKLFFHDDGTLTQGDRKLLMHHFPNAEIMLRADADRIMQRVLPPACWALRESLVFGLKLFDYAHFAKGAPYLACDSDVLFFRDPDELYNSMVNPQGIRWNQDNDHDAEKNAVYCDTPTNIQKKIGITPAPRFNAGLVVMPHALDLNQIEGWIQALQPLRWPYAAEQTIYALMAAEGGSPLPVEYDTIERNWPNVISEHFYWRSRRNMYRLGYPAVSDRIGLYRNEMSYHARSAEFSRDLREGRLQLLHDKLRK